VQKTSSNADSDEVSSSGVSRTRSVTVVKDNVSSDDSGLITSKTVSNTNPNAVSSEVTSGSNGELTKSTADTQSNPSVGQDKELPSSIVGSLQTFFPPFLGFLGIFLTLHGIHMYKSVHAQDRANHFSELGLQRQVQDCLEVGSGLGITLTALSYLFFGGWTWLAAASSPAASTQASSGGFLATVLSLFNVLSLQKITLILLFTCCLSFWLLWKEGVLPPNVVTLVGIMSLGLVVPFSASRQNQKNDRLGGGLAYFGGSVASGYGMNGGNLGGGGEMMAFDMWDDDL